MCRPMFLGVVLHYPFVLGTCLKYTFVGLSQYTEGGPCTLCCAENSEYIGLF